MKLLTDHSLSDHADSIADYMPNDRLFGAKKIKNSALRKFVEGCAYLEMKAEDRLNQVSSEYDIRTTTDYISEWERFVGIPDDCFDISTDIQTRREQVLTKLVSFNLQTEQDFVSLAAAFGMVITIDSTTSFNVVITGPNIVAFVPPYDVPFTPTADQSSLVCWITDLIDALSNVTFVNAP
ncbi:MAG: DUF2313 domain-containing protein [Gammaproteobacteria bacterium]|nr:DUF2313 domain-containing protein [Gammaproteobacteria bacterium]